MKELVEFMAKSLVDLPEEVRVAEIQDGRSTIYELEVAEDDVGKVIGRHGRVVRAMRSLIKAAATRQGTRVDLDIV